MMTHFTTLKETIKSIKELKSIMRIYSGYGGITEVTRVFQASVELFSKIGIKEFRLTIDVSYTQWKVSISMIQSLEFCFMVILNMIGLIQKIQKLA